VAARVSDLRALIHPSAWKRNSANFAITEFSEVACPSAPAGAAVLPPLPYVS
jgi:hypothetical protein